MTNINKYVAEFFGTFWLVLGAFVYRYIGNDVASNDA